MSIHSIGRGMSEQERDAFGNWLSGFVDGEGSFNLSITHDERRYCPFATFTIKLRLDDLPILNRIRNFLGCGRVRRDKGGNPKSKPLASFAVSKQEELIKKIVPHFLRYPLRAKKSRDFAIWREGIRLLSKIKSRGFKCRSTGGHYRKWTEEELEEFRKLRRLLKETRVYAVPKEEYALPRIRRRPKERGFGFWDP